MDSGEFSLRVEQDGQGPVAKIAGDLDVTSAPSLRALFLKHRAEQLTRDFSGVTFMDSTAVGVLVAAHQRAEHDGGHIALQRVQPQQMRLFELTGLTDVVNIDNDGAAPS